MSQVFKPGHKIGILGGGQLARMLALSAHAMGATPLVLSENPQDPAQQVVSKPWIGSLKDPDVLKKFIETVDILTFESEFIDCDLLEKIAGVHKKKIFPSIDNARLLQDRQTQKTLLDKFKIPTAPWFFVHDETTLFSAAHILKYPFVLKKRRNGYDGYGTYIIRNAKNLTSFIQNDLDQPYGFIAEKFIPFRRELACIFFRNKKRQILQFPLVESLQKDSRCYWIKGPVEHKQFQQWVKSFRRLLDKINYVGAIGVELFDAQGKIIVNELAPRVHNTGHYSQNCLRINQFEAHLRAVMGLSLPSQQFVPKGFAMVNLLGSTNAPPPKWTLSPDVSVHWYGKLDNRAGRKMGHINAVDSSPNAALKKALLAAKGFKL